MPRITVTVDLTNVDLPPDIVGTALGSDDQHGRQTAANRAKWRAAFTLANYLLTQATITINESEDDHT